MNNNKFYIMKKMLNLIYFLIKDKDTILLKNLDIILVPLSNSLNYDIGLIIRYGINIIIELMNTIPVLFY